MGCHQSSDAGGQNDSETADTTTITELPADIETNTASDAELNTDEESSVIPTNALLENLMAWYPFDGDATDHSGNGNHGIVHDAILVPDRFNNEDHAYWFDGTTYIDCGNDETLQITGSLTISVWIKPDVFTTGNQGIVSKYLVGDGGQQRSFVLAIENQRHCPGFTSINIPLLAISTNGEYDDDAVEPVSTATCADQVLNTGQWYHLVAVYQPKEYVEIYLNGGLIRRNENRIIPSLHNSTAHLNIGYQFTLDRSEPFFHGTIDDVKIYNTALSDAEVKRLHENMTAGDEIIVE